MIDLTDRKAFGRALRLWHEFRSAAARAANAARITEAELIAAIEAERLPGLLRARETLGPGAVPTEDFEAPDCSSVCKEPRGHNYGYCTQRPMRTSVFNF